MPGPKPCALYLLTTCHVGNDNPDDLFRLVYSVRTAVKDGEVDLPRLVGLLQGCSSAEQEEVARRMPQWVELLSNEASLSSPDARNLLIHHLLKVPDFDPTAMVGFPDDDAWYPQGSLACIARHFGDPQLQLLLTRYGPSPSADGCDKAFRPTLQQALSHGACAGIFVRAGLLTELVGFHELLGLGTALRGGEDTEFVHRAFRRAKHQSICIPGFLVGHAAADPKKKATYYEGGLTAILAHSHASSAARLALARKLAVGLWLVIARRMSAIDYFRSLRRAWVHAPAVRSGSGPGAGDARSQQPDAGGHDPRPTD